MEPKEFFDFVVKSHLENKYEKDFIDYFLLDNKETKNLFLPFSYLNHVRLPYDICELWG